MDLTLQCINGSMNPACESGQVVFTAGFTFSENQARQVSPLRSLQRYRVKHPDSPDYPLGLVTG